MSIVDDGTLLHSVSINLERKHNTPLPTRCEWIRTDNIGLAFSQHRVVVAQYLKQEPAATDCLAIDPEYALGVMDYAHRISGWRLLEYGITRKRLPRLPRAEQLTRMVEGQKAFAWQARPNGVVFPPDLLAAARAARVEDEPTFDELDDAPEAVLATSSS
jgi:hypothetical protein